MLDMEILEIEFFKFRITEAKKGFNGKSGNTNCMYNYHERTGFRSQIYV